MSEPKMRALVLEDDKSTRTLIMTVLQREGFIVDEAADGCEGIDCLTRDDFSLIVLDLMMPGVDGYAVIAHLEKHKPAALKRLIVTTALPPGSVRCESLGDICHFLEKPFDIERLITIARECADLPSAA